jgi:hypothetical protein
MNTHGVVEEKKKRHLNSQSSHNHLSKRSTVMVTTRLIRRVIMAFIAIAVVIGMVFGQTFRNNGTLNNTSTFNTGTFENWRGSTAGKVNNRGTIAATANYLNSNGTQNGVTHNQLGGVAGTVNVNGNYTNSSGTTFNSLAASLIRVGGTLSNTTAANFSTDTGAVDYKAATTQTVLATVKSSTYGGLTLSGGSSAVKTLGGSVVVNGLVTIAASTEFAVGTSNNLTLNAASPFSGTGTFTASATSATVNYNRNDNQNVRSSTYYNLTLADGGTKSAQGNITLASGGALTNNGTFDLTTFDLDMSAASITVPASDTVRTQGNVSFGTNTFTFGGLFLYEKTAANQSIGGATYTNLEIAGGAQKDFPTTTVRVNGVYTAGGAGARAYGTGTFAYGGSGASVTQAVVSGESYYNLTITGAGDTTYTVAGRKQANGSLVITNALSVAATNVLDMQGNTFTTLGSGTNSGKLMWSGNNTHVGGAGVTELYGIGTGSVADGAYGILLFTGSGTKTVAGAGTSATNTGLVAMSIASLAVVDVTGTLTVNGDLENDGLLTNSGSITVQ